VINGYSEAALEKLVRDDELYKSIAEVKRAGERAAWLTRQLLAFSRRQVLQPRILDLNAIVGELARMLQRLIGEHIELVTRLAPRLGGMLADAGQIEQVIMNLVVNARDAMPGGGKVVLETANVDLDEAHARKHTGTASGSFVMLSVTDTGKGMSAATQARIFEPFFTTKEKGEGTGLGLATVYGIVRQSGGYIWVDSELGQGSTFRIYLPRVEGTADAPEERTAVRAVLGSETVLLVEDEEGVRKLIKTLLQQGGYTVIEAQNGSEALAIFQTHADRIQLVVSDIIMPQMSGPELVQYLTALRPGLKFLYISGYTDDSIIQDGLLDAETRFLQKPFTSGNLLSKVREILDENS
jgi:CheY-like chemotaxis protein